MSDSSSYVKNNYTWIVLPILTIIMCCVLVRIVYNTICINALNAKINKNKYNKYNIKCPYCSQYNYFNENISIYGLSETCKVCLDNHINILLPTCKHAVLCDECLEIMNNL
jgi:hypothetical protein